MRAQTSFRFEDPETRAEGFLAVLLEDIPDVVALGEDFYAESELSALTPFSPKAFSDTLTAGLEGGYLRGVVFRTNALPAGFVFYTLDRSYTQAPLALIWLLYVIPRLRRSPLGKLLLALVEGDARRQGAVALYGGAMAGIPKVKNSLPNLYRRQGFEDLYWGRKILKELS